MQALTFGGKEIINYSTVTDPVLLHPSDAIVKITMSGICGSDLHVYHGRETGLDHGTVMGHEFVGRGWSVKWQSGSHTTMQRAEWPDFVWAFHDGEDRWLNSSTGGVP